MQFVMTQIPAEKGRGWTVLVDGKEVKPGIIEISSKFGMLTYGMRPEGYDSWVFRETGGGGAVTLPFTRTPEGIILVGLLREKRANMGEPPVWCVIGGFVSPGEAHDKAQAREANEEAGLDSTKAYELPGFAINPNRLFFVADASAGEGVRAYSLEVSFDLLEEENETSSDGRETFKSGIYKFKNASSFTGFKKAGEVRFFPWRLAVNKIADALALSAILKLLAKAL